MTAAWAALREQGIRLRREGEAPERQALWLGRCLQCNRASEFGRCHGFERIFTVADFRQRVPLSVYADVAPAIARMADGEPNIQFEGRPIAFERTGGSTGGTKLVPYSSASLDDFRVAMLPWLADAIAAYGLAEGCAYWAISPATRQVETTAGGCPVGLPDGAYLGEAALPAFAQLSAVPPSVGAIPDVASWQLATLYWLLRRDDLELISIWSPTFFLTLLDALWERREQLAALLRSGGVLPGHEFASDTAALRRFHSYLRDQDARVLWPGLRLVSCWADASSKSYHDELKTRLAHAAFQGKGLLATEGVLTIPDFNNRTVPAVDSGFFEFLDMSGHAKLVHELKPGEGYEAVMTTSGGLYRYRTGDWVTCEGYAADLPVLRFRGRRGLVSDLVGEKLTEEFVARGLEAIPGFRILVPLRQSAPRYALILDKDNSMDADALAASLEAYLSTNPQYAYARRLTQLGPLSVHCVAKPIANYVKRAMKAGARLGDVKIPALRPETDWLETFLQPAS